MKLHDTAQSSCISTMFASLAVVIVGLCYCSTGGGQSFLETPQLFGPSEALVGDIVKFRCELPNHPKNEPVLMHLLHSKWESQSTSLNGEAGFTLVIKRRHEGNLVCEATLQNNTNSVEATFSNTHYLKVVEPVKGAAIIVHSGPVQFFEGATLNLSCQTTAGNYLTYKWLLNDKPIPRSPFHVMSDKHLLIYRTTSKDSGSYKCEASNEFNNTVHTNTSKEVVIIVKDMVSNPDVSFVVLKWNSHNYSAEVTCNSTRGTLPITFSLYNREQLIGNVTSKERKATFKVPVVLGQHMGWLQCQADNGDRTAHSQWMALKVEPVGGPVTMNYECDMGENYAVVHLRFFCKVAKGSHPSYKWFLNNTLLSEQQSFYRVDNQPPGESMLLLSVGRESAGTYHCEASDSFDNTTSISSMKLYMDKEVLNHLPVLVVAVVFGCFTVLIVLVSACCCVGVVFRRRRFGENSLLGLEMKKNIIAYEGELDPLDCSEDEDLGNTTSWAEFDQASEASADEWPQIMEEKKTLEDGPVEFP